MVEIYDPSFIATLDAPLLIHEVEFNDELINPLPADSNAYQFISAEKSIDVDFRKGTNLRTEIDIKVWLSGELYVQNRTVYNFWDLLGDVGGFHDGLLIVTSLFMGFVAQMAFENAYVHEKMSDGLADSEKDKDFQNSAQFKLCVSHINEGR